MIPAFDSTSSSFYRNRYPRPPVLDKGNYGPSITGKPYLDRWDPNRRAWFRPDGSRAGLAGLGLTLPELDLSESAGTRETVDKQTFVMLAGALALGLGGGWALQHRHGLIGAGLLGIAGIGAIVGVIRIKQNLDVQAAYAAWQGRPVDTGIGSKAWIDAKSANARARKAEAEARGEVYFPGPIAGSKIWAQDQ